MPVLFRHLEFNNKVDDFNPNPTFAAEILASQVLLDHQSSWTSGPPPHTSQRSSVGSSLEKLTLNVMNPASFFCEYAMRARQNRLGHLVLGDMRGTQGGERDDWDVLETYLPRLVYLRDLTISQEQDLTSTIETTPLIGTLKRNGSLHRLHLPDDAMTEQLSPQGFQKVQAYLTRNYVVPTLLANPRLPSCKSGNESKLESLSVDGVQVDDDGDDTKMIPSLFPTVVTSMLPVEEMSPNMFLTGLLALDSTIGRGRMAGAVRSSNNEVSGRAAKRRRTDSEQPQDIADADTSWFARAKQSIATFWRDSEKMTLETY
jgi:hypothetical protein